MKRQKLIIERSKDGKWWGRVEFDDDLMIDAAPSLDGLQKKMKKLLINFHQLEASKVSFELVYDLTALFSKIDYLNVTAVAAKANISPALMRQYVAGFKYPSPERAKEIERIIHELGEELAQVKVTVVKDKFDKSSKNRSRASL